MKLNSTAPIVDVSWLQEHLHNEYLVLLDATIPKAGSATMLSSDKINIPGSRFFDIKNVFSDTSNAFPNAIPSPEQFEAEAQRIGISSNSCIVVYDDLGIYSSARVWWLFKTFGFENVAVLDGGLPAWLAAGFETETSAKSKEIKAGNFKATYHAANVKFTGDILDELEQRKHCILDARSEGRFHATQPEPRADLKGGHIPTSKSLAFTMLQDNGKMKPKEELQKIFAEKNSNNLPLIFTCGSGITACILGLGATLAGITSFSVYDGSWTEWASTPNLPIEK